MVLTCTRSVVPDYTAPCMLGHLSRVPGLMEQWDPANPVLMHYIKNTNYTSGSSKQSGLFAYPVTVAAGVRGWIENT